MWQNNGVFEYSSRHYAGSSFFLKLDDDVLVDIESLNNRLSLLPPSVAFSVFCYISYTVASPIGIASVFSFDLTVHGQVVEDGRSRSRRELS